MHGCRGIDWSIEVPPVGTIFMKNASPFSSNYALPSASQHGVRGQPPHQCWNSVCCDLVRGNHSASLSLWMWQHVMSTSFHGTPAPSSVSYVLSASSSLMISEPLLGGELIKVSCLGPHHRHQVFPVSFVVKILFCIKLPWCFSQKSAMCLCRSVSGHSCPLFSVYIWDEPCNVWSFRISFETIWCNSPNLTLPNCFFPSPSIYVYIIKTLPYQWFTLLQNSNS